MVLEVVLARRARAIPVDQVLATAQIIEADVVADQEAEVDQTLPEMARQIR
jgi:hypothetical protein